MKFVLHRDRTIASTFGHAIEFKKGVLTEVPPLMHAEVLAAGGVPESELDLEPKKPEAVTEPTDPNERKKAVFAMFEKVVLRNKRDDFTAGGAPHGKVLALELGWTLPNKERDLLWVAYAQRDKD